MRASLCILACLLSFTAVADERILDFHADIVVHPDGWLDVTETIRVRAEGRNIRRGIYREYPTRYRDRFGNVVKVDYEPRSVLRNGKPEPFHTEPRSNGVITYFGAADVYVGAGEHTYEYRYRAGRMLGFFGDHDELYWNVTGLDWAFPIDSAGATVSLAFPVVADEIGVEAFTGGRGDTGSAYRTVVGDGRANVETTKGLGVREGLTIVVTWPAGFVAEPGNAERLAWLLRDNANLLIALAGLLAMLAWYLPAWFRFGRDPEPGVTVTRYEPPRGLSPASLRYIRRMGYDNKVMTAAIMNLAVKGYLQIDSGGVDHVLRKTDAGASPPALARGEHELLRELFGDGDFLTLTDANHARLGAAREAHQRSLRDDYRNRLFRINGLLNLPALLLMIVAIVVAVSYGRGATPATLAAVAAMVATAGVFAWLMRAPTMAGRRVLDETDGFREYLEIAEKDEMNLRNPPQKTPELFEKYLPFALALGVEQAWAERFADVLARLRGEDGGPYHPAWYRGSWTSASLSSHTASLSSGLDSAISSSMTPPGSSSGAGGGGFSGGGGGGGGGGGW